MSTHLVTDLQLAGAVTFTDVLGNQSYTADNITLGLNIEMPATGGFLLSF